MITVLPASAVPLKVGAFSLVMPPSVMLSLNVAVAASGMPVSTVKSMAVLAALRLPPASSTTVWKLWVPSSSEPGLNVQLPLMSTVTRPSSILLL